jgi:hypothetical protein
MQRFIASCVTTAAIVAASISSGTAQAAAGQGQGGGPAGQAGGGGRGGTGRTPSALRSVPAETTAAKAKDSTWRAPTTAWGHPDIEGTWTSDDMRGVPQERNPNQADRLSLTPEEFARRAGGDEANRDRAVNQETFLRNEFGIRTFGYTSIIVEPANGRRPALTAKGQARVKAQAGIGTFGTRPLNGFEDFSLYDRCITRGIASITPVLYGNGLRIVQSPSEVVVTYEMVHDSRVISLDGGPRVPSKVIHTGAGKATRLSSKPRISTSAALASVASRQARR